MKKITLLSIATLLFSFNGFSQDDEPSFSSTRQKKYFITLGYGIGTARWYSTLNNTVMYDKNGNVIKSGEIQFTARNTTKFYCYEGTFPVMKVRMGLGISFEQFYLDQLAVNAAGNESNLLFDESFRFDKIYYSLEVPFKFDTDKPYSFSGMTKVGYFNYNGIERFNFFGEEPIAKSFLFNLGFLADYKVFPHTYVFLYPCAEFKYFRNNKDENPSSINHNIVSYNVVGGLRIDVSKE